MNAFPNGTRVFYWASGGEIKYGTVQATNRMADVRILCHSGRYSSNELSHRVPRLWW
ncbi:hypothetical protein BD769DRAFT_1445014 [Suillus cothurnatus]|nr:hypothetical protein BD769DRAFT_1445014 [Suillus cothurnatus]